MRCLDNCHLQFFNANMFVLTITMSTEYTSQKAELRFVNLSILFTMVSSDEFAMVLRRLMAMKAPKAMLMSELLIFEVYLQL